MEQEHLITELQDEGEDVLAQQALAGSGPIPRHIAMIMDGNGRWAQDQGFNRVAGHYEGVASVRDITEACAEIGVEYLTLYTFSVENWHRPSSEVDALMQLLIHTIRKETETLHRNNIRLNAIGDTTQLPDACRVEFEEAIALTADNARMTLTLALSYSGRWELTRAMKTLAGQVRDGTLDPEDIDESTIAAALCTHDFPDPDLLIRTGGELRISNFLLWQIAYSELYITDRYWPAFRRKHLYEAIHNYQERERRFGRVLG